MSKFDPVITLCQTADFIKEAQDLVKEVTLDELLADSIKLRAFERIMELVGESIKGSHKISEIPTLKYLGEK